MTNIERLTKIEAAERQLAEAILLFFERRDTIAIHSLAAAAHQVYSDLAVAMGVESVIKNNPHLTRDPILRKEYFALMNQAFNFMKHANRDADAELDFRPKVTPFFIFDAILIHNELKNETPWVFTVFLAWFSATFPDFITDGDFKNAVNRLLGLGLDTENFDLICTLARHGPV